MRLYVVESFYAPINAFFIEMLKRFLASGRVLASSKPAFQMRPISIFVGNLPFTVTETQLKEFFSAHGTVTSAKVITDRETGKVKGFGFVDMDDADGKKVVI
jgi:RNA recognition motif-containing protein